MNLWQSLQALTTHTIGAAARISQLIVCTSVLQTKKQKKIRKQLALLLEVGESVWTLKSRSEWRFLELRRKNEYYW